VRIGQSEMNHADAVAVRGSSSKSSPPSSQFAVP
jgi:hypothetical protein